MEISNPYIGLKPFDINSAAQFYGRNKAISDLLTKIRSNRFVAVTGQRGIGKSSLLQSGLVPRLQQGFTGIAGAKWRCAVCTPGLNPIANLANALSRQNVLGGDQAVTPDYSLEVEQTLMRSGQGLIHAYQDSNIANENLLIIIDSFEDLFRYQAFNPNVQKDDTSNLLVYINLLLQASREKNTAIYVIISLDETYMSHCTPYRGLPEAISEGQFLLPRLNRGNLKEIISLPLAAKELQIETELVNHILEDYNDDDNNLPLLAHSLQKSWELWKEDFDNNDDKNILPPILQKHYDKAGTIDHSLNLSLNEIYENEIDIDDQAHCVEVFKRLSEHLSDKADLRRPVKFKELVAVCNASKATLSRVIHPFSSNGFINVIAATSSGNQKSINLSSKEVILIQTIEEEAVIDIAHPIIIKKWDKMKNWISAETEKSDLYLNLVNDAKLFQKGQTDYWFPPILTLGLEWRDKKLPNEPWALRYDSDYKLGMKYLEDSERKAILRTREGILEKERKTQRRKRLLLFFGSLAIMALVAAGFAIQETREAHKERDLAEVQVKVAKAEKERAKLAENYASKQRIQADDAREVAIKEREKANAARRWAETQRKKAVNNEYKAITLAAEADILLATAEQQASITAIIAKQLEEEARLAEEEAKIARKNETAAKKDKAIAIESERKFRLLSEIRKYEIRANNLLSANRIDSAKIVAIQAYDKYQEYIKAGGNDVLPEKEVYNTLFSVYNELRSNSTDKFTKHQAGVRKIAVSNTGLRATGDENGIIRFPNTNKFFKTKSKIRSLTFNKKGNLLAAGCFDGKIMLWDINASSGTEGILFKDMKESIQALFIVGKANYIIAVGTNNVHIISSDGKIVQSIPSNYNYNAAVSEDNFNLITATKQGLTTYWLNTNANSVDNVVKRTESLNLLNDVSAISTHGNKIVIGDELGQIHTGKISEIRYARAFDKVVRYHKTRITSIDFNPSGYQFTTASLDLTAKIWDWNYFNSNAKRERSIISLENQKNWPWDIKYISNTRIMIGNENGQVVYWYTTIDALKNALDSLK
jgi:energy-coupling factor transporter ATP-binding protein EcfA2